ncbi:MAG: multicopper oxidase domain-containing protein [Paludibacteraceae bacterium]|nr:multicopper oxidase domain-containing protein [Paludibacteraceae bacterium]
MTIHFSIHLTIREILNNQLATCGVNHRIVKPLLNHHEIKQVLIAFKNQFKLITIFNWHCISQRTIIYLIIREASLYNIFTIKL